MNRDVNDDDTPASGMLLRPFVELRFRSDEPPEEDQLQGSTLRPFLLTSGRVRTADESIAIETQVMTTDLGRSSVHHLGFEQHDIVTLCDDPLSVAEIAAKLDLHLSVVRILVGDLGVAGYLTVYRPSFNASNDVQTITRVIRGLRAIS